MQTEFKEKPSIIEQIEFVAGARKIVDDNDFVEFDGNNSEMLKAIEENLIALRNLEYAGQKKQRKIMFEQPNDEVRGDYNAHEEAERQHRIQRDLK